jgi:hypothetical protein
MNIFHPKGAIRLVGMITTRGVANLTTGNWCPKGTPVIGFWLFVVREISLRAASGGVSTSDNSFKHSFAGRCFRLSRGKATANRWTAVPTGGAYQASTPSARELFHGRRSLVEGGRDSAREPNTFRFSCGRDQSTTMRRHDPEQESVKITESPGGVVSVESA